MGFLRTRHAGSLAVVAALLAILSSTALAFIRSSARAAEPAGATISIAAAAGRAERVLAPDALVALTNRDRAEHDLDELRLARRLTRYATAHSRAMAERGAIFHSTEDELRGALESVEWAVAGENVGVGGSLDEIQDAFMASTGHRRNVLSAPYDRVAVGAVQDHGRIWVTVVFYGA